MSLSHILSMLTENPVMRGNLLELLTLLAFINSPRLMLAYIVPPSRSKIDQGWSRVGIPGRLGII